MSFEVAGISAARGPELVLAVGAMALFELRAIEAG